MKIRSYVGLLLLLSTVIVFYSCGSKKEEGKKANQGQRNRVVPKVDAYVVSPSMLVNQISVSGSLVSFEEVELRNEVPGRVVGLNLPEGKFVKKGTLLVKIFDDDLQANLSKLKSQLAIQEKILERQSELLKINGISQNDYDQLTLQVNSLKSDIEVVKAQIRKTEVLAPFDGVIGLRNISPGAFIPSSTLLATIRMEDKLKLDFSVPEKYSGMINTGMSVKFSLQGGASKYDASVMATEKGIESSTRNLKVRAVVDNPSKDLIPGAYTNVELLLGENSNALLIPTHAIIPQERSKSVILAKNGKAHFVEVETGIRTTESIEVLSGVQPGDTVIISGVLFLKEGVTLSYSNIKTGSL
ncbi:MAG: efflux RND transporter periplasmic adaptor subunit [Prolixibacteraceae bacterium]|nr:efflux RND transporter periplasmic adaptor subunit [Prolixibacteraceae bacterium]